jgi:hypothetical protein
VLIDHAPCTKLHKREQKDRTKTLPEFPNHVLKDYGEMHRLQSKSILVPYINLTGECPTNNLKGLGLGLGLGMGLGWVWG